MYLERPPLLGLHLIRRLFSRHVRKPVTGKTAKEKETGRAPGSSEVSSKAFSSAGFVPTIFISPEDDENFRPEKNFSTSERNLATGLTI